MRDQHQTIYFRMQWIINTYDNTETTHYTYISYFYKSLSFIDPSLPDSPLKDEKVKNSKRTVFSFKKVLIILIVYFDFFDVRVQQLSDHFSLPASQYLNWIILSSNYRQVQWQIISIHILQPFWHFLWNFLVTQLLPVKYIMFWLRPRSTNNDSVTVWHIISRKLSWSHAVLYFKCY